MPDMEETSLRSESVFDGVLLKVFRDQVALSDGSRSVREWIDHPGASAVVPLLDDGSILLVRQYRFAPRRAFLEVPAGKCDKRGEDPLAVAARELSEETGCTADKITLLGPYFPCVGYSNESVHLFLAEGITRGAANPDDGEFVEAVSMPFSAAVEMARDGRLVDMKTVVAILRAEAFLAGRSTTQ